MKNEKKIFIGSIIVSFLIAISIFWFDNLINVTLLPDKGASWYYWKLPEPDTMARISAWTLYLVHQVAAWYLLYKIMKLPKDQKRTFTKYNGLLLGLNLSFITLHFIQTYLWYDGLAQDVSVWSSQYSVIVMLVLILAMENGRRGLFFKKKVKLPQQALSAIFKYHGLYIAWAVIYTFWFHPVVGTVGHVFGFFYMFLLMVQMSFTNTKFHTNRIWTFFLEVLVCFHGTAVAIISGNGMWPMFFFGFAFIIITTQIHGLKIPFNWRTGIVVLYFLGAITYYAMTDIGKIHQITWIPIVEYALVFIIPWLIQGFLSLKNKRTPLG